MFARSAVMVLFLLPLVAGAASKKGDDVEYLIPEDWDSKKAEAPQEVHLDLTANSFLVSMRKHLKEIPQCSTAKLSDANPIKGGQVVYHTIKLNSASVDVLLDVDGKGKISNAKFTGVESPRNDPQMVAMLCSTYAIMRTLQPVYETPEQAQGNMTHLWKSASEKPFKMAFYSNNIKAQVIPFEMNVF
ncbi:hypothetical protein DM819_15235 [Pseudomonas hunanensis]|uniref:Uncharacterized protein n=1 Tax=Pseudomonas hunanensis TaxID=1247546 RepID=A0ABD6N1Q7_9PSED|nr:hypothetical protein [Pseudomonas hunanensis]NWL47168.1 hypothetical protein [Pseudomonas hunanensis]